MAIRQKAKGQHAATFPAPTLANNAIVVLLASADGGLSVTDDKGNSYETNIGNTGQIGNTTLGNGGTQTAFIPTLNTMVAGIRTITASDASAYLWIYEITDLIFVGSGSPAFPDGNPDTWDGIGSQAGVVLLDPTIPWLWQNNLGNFQTLPASDDYFSIVYGDTGGFASVDSGWTFDGAQGNAAVAYLLGASGSTFGGTPGCEGATFSPAQSSWCASGFSFRVSAPTTGSIVIQKTTVPGGSAQSFTFTPSYGVPFNLTDGQNNVSGPLAAGTYSVVETPIAGWITTTSSDPNNIVVSPGSTTTITFTNTAGPSCPVQLINGNFMDALGNRLAYGTLKLQLTGDTLICTHDGQLVAGRKFNVALDENGNIAGIVNVEPNDLLLPAGTKYRTLAYASDGRQAWARPQYWIVPSTAATLDVGTLVPSA